MPQTSQAIDLDLLRRRCSDCDVRDLCLPSGLEAGDLIGVDALAEAPERLKKGQALFRAGGRFHSFYVVRSGSLKSYSLSEQGDVQVLGFHFPGEILGLDGLIDDRHRCYSEALEPSSVCCLPYRRLDETCRRLPSLQRQLMRLLSRDHQDGNEHMIIMGRTQAMARLALFLTNLSRRQGRLGRSAVNLTLSMSRTDIANYLGLVLETVSRLFRQLQERGVLEVRRQQILIVDAKALQRLSQE